MKLLDTNTLLNGATGGVLTYPVLEELDRLKSREGITGKQARDAIKYIYNNLDGFDILEDEKRDLQSVDDFLLEVAEEHKYMLVTYDLSLYLKAVARGIDCDFGLTEEYDYSGGTYLTEEEFNNFDLVMEKDLPENHYLFYDDYIFRVEDGEVVRVEAKTLKNFFVGEIAPRNPEQVALIDLFLRDVPVVVATGYYGSGKSYLTLTHAISLLEQGKVSKLVVVPNNSFVENTREVAAVPGGLLEKEFMHLGPLIDLMGMEELQNRYNRGEIEIMPISVARGRNIENSFIWVNKSPVIPYPAYHRGMEQSMLTVKPYY